MGEGDIDIYPSILSADFSNLANQLKEAESAGFAGIHVDMMDGQFVPPITFGTQIINAVRQNFSGFIDVHMMVVSPIRFAEELSAAGVDSVSLHIETLVDPASDLRIIKNLGLNSCLALNPSTSLKEIYPYLEIIDQVLIMSVEPGYGGQSFIKESLVKISELKEKIKRQGLKLKIQVDGGVNISTIKSVHNAGADLVVAGSAVFSPNFSVSQAYFDLKKALSADTL